MKLKNLFKIIKESLTKDSNLNETEETIYSIINNTISIKSSLIINPLDSDCIYIECKEKNICIQVNTTTNFITITQEKIFFQSTCSNKLMQMIQTKINKEINMQAFNTVQDLSTNKENILHSINCIFEI